jgi:hypothetical protein
MLLLQCLCKERKVMKPILGILITLFASLSFAKELPFTIETPKVDEHYIGKVKFDNISIRILVLKHTFDSIANTDAKQAISAANLAASKGLTIKDIGNYHITKEGKVNPLIWGKKVNFDKLKAFIKEQSKVDARPEDTLIIYTVGHGGTGGGLQSVGQRRELAKVLAEVAEETNQEIFWWQLSCYAAAYLPEISSFNEKQQELFSMLASSPANQSSYFCTQGAQMEKVFVAMAERSKAIDPDGNEIIMAGELTDFLNTAVGKGRGDLLFARSRNEPIFGIRSLARQVPIKDMDGSNTDYPKDYIPIPSSRS